MFKNPIFYGALAFAATALFLGLIIPAAICMDGWESSSIGTQGACSHHGGVNTIPETLAMLASLTAGFFAWSKAKKHEHILRSKDNKFIPKVENCCSGAMLKINSTLCFLWNGFAVFLKKTGVLKYLEEKTWGLVGLVFILGLLFPPFSFIFYALGIAALLNNADPQNGFLIRRKSNS